MSQSRLELRDPAKLFSSLETSQRPSNGRFLPGKSRASVRGATDPNARGDGGLVEVLPRGPSLARNASPSKRTEKSQVRRFKHCRLLQAGQGPSHHANLNTEGDAMPLGQQVRPVPALLERAMPARYAPTSQSSGGILMPSTKHHQKLI